MLSEENHQPNQKIESTQMIMEEEIKTDQEKSVMESSGYEMMPPQSNDFINLSAELPQLENLLFNPEIVAILSKISY